MKGEPLYTEQSTGYPMLNEPPHLRNIQFNCELVTAMRIHALSPGVPFTVYRNDVGFREHCECQITVATAENVISELEKFAVEELEEPDCLLSNKIAGGLRLLVNAFYEDVAA